MGPATTPAIQALDLELLPPKVDDPENEVVTGAASTVDWEYITTVEVPPELSVTICVETGTDVMVDFD